MGTRPGLAAYMAKRAGAHRTIEIPGASHAIPVAHPQATAELILAGDRAARRRLNATTTTQKEPHMSPTTTYTGVGVAERECRTNHGGGNAARAEESTETTRRFANEWLVEGEPLAVDTFVARVLGQAHQAAHAHAAPDEARVILDLAQSFADELAKTNPRFDRLRFIEAATEEPSHA